MLALYTDRGYYWLDGDEPEHLCEADLQDAQAIAPNERGGIRCARPPGCGTGAAPRPPWRSPVGSLKPTRAPPSVTSTSQGSKIFCGEPAEAIPLLEKAIKLDPYKTHICSIDIGGSASRYCLLSARVRLCSGSSVRWAHVSTGRHKLGPRLLAASYALMGDIGRARLILSEFADAFPRW